MVAPSAAANGSRQLGSDSLPFGRERDQSETRRQQSQGVAHKQFAPLPSGTAIEQRHSARSRIVEIVRWLLLLLACGLPFLRPWGPRGCRRHTSSSDPPHRGRRRHPAARCRRAGRTSRPHRALSAASRRFRVSPGMVVGERVPERLPATRSATVEGSDRAHPFGSSDRSRLERCLCGSDVVGAGAAAALHHPACNHSILCLAQAAACPAALDGEHF